MPDSFCRGTKTISDWTSFQFTHKNQPSPQALRFSQGGGERLVMNRKGSWEGYSLRAHFHRERDVWVRGNVRTVTIIQRVFITERSCAAPSGESPME